MKSRLPKVIFSHGCLLSVASSDDDDDSHLKHDINLNAKGPYLARQLSDCLAAAISSNVIA
jgi:hypothetical protein